jgi:hypothetical protein
MPAADAQQRTRRQLLNMITDALGVDAERVRAHRRGSATRVVRWRIAGNEAIPFVGREPASDEVADPFDPAFRVEGEPEDRAGGGDPHQPGGGGGDGSS